MSEIKIRESELIPIDKIHPNIFNANEESDESFNALVQEIQEDGFDQPLQVVPCVCDQIDGDHYVIIGGEHRYKAMLTLDAKEIPCHIYTNWNEDVQKLKSVRRNMLKGDLNDRKFTALVKSFEEKGYDRETLANLMAFDADDDMEKHIIEDKERQDRSIIDGFLNEAQKEIEAVDGLSDILNHLFSEYGDTVDQNFMFLNYKGKCHLMVTMEPGLFSEIEQTVTDVKESGENMSEHLLHRLQSSRAETKEAE